MRIVRVKAVRVPKVRVRDIKDEHILMAGAYGGGAFFSHSTIGNIVVGIGYLSVTFIGIHENHKREAARED